LYNYLNIISVKLFKINYYKKQEKNNEKKNERPSMYRMEEWACMPSPYDNHVHLVFIFIKDG
jgi:hypothetical protein